MLFSDFFSLVDLGNLFKRDASGDKLWDSLRDRTHFYKNECSNKNTKTNIFSNLFSTLENIYSHLLYCAAPKDYALWKGNIEELP